MATKKHAQNSSSLPRRDFLKLSALSVAGMATQRLTTLPVLANEAKFVPTDKGTVTNLLARGTRETYTKENLKFIGMPIGGICAGQVNLGGDGQLWLWDIFNRVKFGVVDKQVSYNGEMWSAGGGANYLEPPTQVHPFAHGFAVRIKSGRATQIRTLDGQGWSDVRFTGEYPIGFVEYSDSQCPVKIALEAFSPFIPLDEERSGFPVVLKRYTLTNTSKSPVTVQIGGWMENPIALFSGQPENIRRNESTVGGVKFSLIPAARQATPRPAIVFEDWSKSTFEDWTAEGDAFGPGPFQRPANSVDSGTLTPGRRLARSYRDDIRASESNLQLDSRTGKLTSRTFTIDRNFIEYWICGGNFPDTLGLRLYVEGKLVRKGTGRQDETKRLEVFDVREFLGKSAHLEILDAESKPWGQCSIGRISFVDQRSVTITDAHDFGTMELAVVENPTTAKVRHDLGSNPLQTLFDPNPTAKMFEAPVPNRPNSGVVRELKLEPGKSATVTFQIAWMFPNLSINLLGRVGNYYAEKFKTTGAVIESIRKNYASLYATTKAWHNTWYDSTLPYWFLDRTMASATILNSMTCARFASGRFYGWEGIGCCDGTCGHVWQYAHTMGRLFPNLERNIRERADYVSGIGFDDKTGIIDFRAEFRTGYAADAQAGYILRTFREHQTSTDSAFLKRVYPKMKRALQFLITQDGNGNGVLEGRQHNTLDVDLYGPSSWLTSMYLAALRAGEEMATEMGDSPFASECRTIFNAGSQGFVKTFWNGHYFIQQLKLDEHPDAMRIGNGCEADQLMGQGWAHQIGLGRVVDADHSKMALRELYRNNFIPDIGNWRKSRKRGRWYAMPGESGLVMCSFPAGDESTILGPSPTWAAMYFNECFTGSEYQAAAHMVAEGLVEEGLRVTKAVHDRHHPSLRNPWNEIECSDHYARSMASYGVYVATSGFTYHGPKGQIGFDPKLSPENFRAAFTAAEGWGTYEQTKSASQMKASIAVKYGQVRMKQISLNAPAGTAQVTLNGKAVGSRTTHEGNQLKVVLSKYVDVPTGSNLQIVIKH